MWLEHQRRTTITVPTCWWHHLILKTTVRLQKMLINLYPTPKPSTKTVNELHDSTIQVIWKDITRSNEGGKRGNRECKRVRISSTHIKYVSRRGFGNLEKKKGVEGKTLTRWNTCLIRICAKSYTAKRSYKEENRTTTSYDMKYH